MGSFFKAYLWIIGFHIPHGYSEQYLDRNYIYNRHFYFIEYSNAMIVKKYEHLLIRENISKLTDI